MKKERILIVGAGIAGASTAWHASQMPGVEVVILDKETAPDLHSSGRNAAILRTAHPSPQLHAMALESLRFYQTPPADFDGEALISQQGLCLATSAPYADALLPWVDHENCAADGRPIAENTLREQLPFLRPGLHALREFPSEGVLQVSKIHHGFLRGAQNRGAHLMLETAFESLMIEHGKITGVETSKGPFKADKVVMAAGAWADSLMRSQGLAKPMVSFRRHLLVTERADWIPQSSPAVWVLGSEFYFRPEQGGFLISGCDESQVNPAQGELVDPAVMESMRKKMAHWIPDALELGVARFWAGMRTFSPDGKMVLGADLRVEGLHWAAALGGHGMTCAPAIGRVVAAGLRQKVLA